MAEMGFIYHQHRRLGEGGYGQVYEATRHARDGRQQAICAKFIDNDKFHKFSHFKMHMRLFHEKHSEYQTNSVDNLANCVCVCRSKSWRKYRTAI